MPTKSTMLTMSTTATKPTLQARRHWGGAFRGRALSQIIACAPKRELYPPSEDCAPKESNSPCAAGWHFGAVPPQIAACAPQK